MKKLKKEEDRKIRLSISMNPTIYDIINDNTTNKSRYIEYAVLEFFKKNDIK
mgnify:CR=1 FL=1